MANHTNNTLKYIICLNFKINNCELVKHTFTKYLHSKVKLHRIFLKQNQMELKKLKIPEIKIEECSHQMIY